MLLPGELLPVHFMARIGGDYFDVLGPWAEADVLALRGRGSRAAVAGEQDLETWVRDYARMGQGSQAAAERVARNRAGLQAAGEKLLQPRTIGVSRYLA